MTRPGLIQKTVSCDRVTNNLKYNRLVGLVVTVSASRERKIPGSNPARAEIFPGSSHTNDLEIGTPVATLSGAWQYRVGPVSVYYDWVRWKV